jgi:DNA-directed RNA polymerase subunit K/omega
MAAASVGLPDDVVPNELLGRFHVAVVAFQRARQLQNSARPRVEADGHKIHRIALMEVMAGTIPWSVEEKVVALGASADYAA